MCMPTAVYLHVAHAPPAQPPFARASALARGSGASLGSWPRPTEARLS
jgi:hypothetical protein